MKRITTKEWIKRAKSVHGDKFDYSNTEYINAKTKVKIICPIHGEFEQIPTNHINSGHGCMDCFLEWSRSNLKIFIEKAIKIHGDKYDYSLVKYKTDKTKVKIICPVHGEFEQLPNSHLNGRGCPYCGGLNNCKDGLSYLLVFQSQHKLYHDTMINKEFRIYREDIGKHCSKQRIELFCKYCKKWFRTNDKVLVTRRLGVFTFGRNGECNFYCSDNCKEHCPTYNQKYDPYEIKHDVEESFTSAELNIWAEHIKMNDDYECQMCGSKEKLQAHHIKPKSIYPEYALDIDNGITLCFNCHRKIGHVNNECKINSLKNICRRG